MVSVLDTCRPRPELLAGSFNPEVFTASLSPIMAYYHEGRETIDPLYTHAELFFREATYPTQGLRQALTEIFSRIAGDRMAPAIHRLETAFGGGKTHTLIACAHIAFRGTELKEAVQGILDPGLLPEPGTVAVVGVAGDEIPVHRPKGDDLVPYTLWGEIAYQIGGPALYEEVEEEAGSYAAPGRTYFERVFGGRKALIMLDELAQYAARLEAARPDASGQLAAFLMSLHGYARNHSGISIVLTLASAADAFARQTARLAQLVGQVRGEEISEDDALSLGEQAVRGVASVVARDAVQITPVMAAEISSVFAKRLFVSIDRQAAESVADEYMQMYRRNSSYLPDEAIHDGFRARMVAHYPFHPTLVDFLNKKLASAEHFQGTRGVLRVLSLVVRSLWMNHQAVPMIHTCHLDMRSDRVVNEILGRTGSSDLLYILNTDVGSVDTQSLEGGMSNAQLADRRNPHPEGYPLYEYTWKTVFLHSLVGRNEGLNSRIFGITEPEALFDVSFPGLTPPQVRTALEEIQESAFYLRFEQGRYYASEEPTINSVLARIRRTVQARQVEDLLHDTVRKIIGGHSPLFQIQHDVSLPEDLPDGKGRPMLGVVSLTADSVDLLAMVTTAGAHRPREQQNLVFLLVPETVAVLHESEQQNLFPTRGAETRQHLETLARQLKAMQILADKPQSYGVNPRRLDESDFRKRRAEREQALQSAVSSAYTRLYYSDTLTGKIVYQEIKTAGGEKGFPFLEVIRNILVDAMKLIPEERLTSTDLLPQFRRLFFDRDDTVSVAELRRNFLCLRGWPILENSGMVDRIVRLGVQTGQWCLYRMGAEEAGRPEEFYDQDVDIPLGLDLREPGYGLVTLQGARQRGWKGERPIAPVDLRREVRKLVEDRGSVTVADLQNRNGDQTDILSHGDFPQVLADLVRERSVFIVHVSPVPGGKAEVVPPERAIYYELQPSDELVSRSEVLRRGLIETPPEEFTLDGREGADRFLPLLRRLGSLFNKGAKTTLDELDITGLELPHGGRLRLELTNAGPDDMRELGELFEVLAGVANDGAGTAVYLKVRRPDEECPFLQELKRS